jgi:hypothetical protein
MAKSGKHGVLYGPSAGSRGNRCIGCQHPIAYGERCEGCKRKLRDRKRRKPR